MHGIVHKTLKEYVVEGTDDEIWRTIAERAAVEPVLYLPISVYDDHEIDAIFETLASMATQDRRQLERGVGRMLGPELLATFDAHVRDSWDLFDLLERIEVVTESVDSSNDELSLPDVSSTRMARSVIVTYQTHREPIYCGLAHGILEGLVEAFDAEATVTERTCARNGNATCTFQVKRT